MAIFRSLLLSMFLLAFTHCANRTADLNTVVLDEGDTRAMRLIDGDMLVEESQLSVGTDGNDVSASRAGRNLYQISARHWANGIIPISFAPNINNVQKELVFAACAKWSQTANIRCREARSSDYNNYLRVIKGGLGCYASYGRPNDGPALMNLNDHMPVSQTLPQGTCMQLGIVMHEFGHILGMIHEHSRPDRDNYIRILTENMDLPCDSVQAKFKTSEVVRVGENYDYRSIMHYTRFQCSKNRKETIVPREDLGDYKLGDSVIKTARLSTADGVYARDVYGKKK